MENIIHLIEECWVYRLVSILNSTLGLLAIIAAIILGGFPRIIFGWRYRSLLKLGKPLNQLIVLGPKHCRSPNIYSISGRQVLITGVIFAIDPRKRSFTLLLGFPLDVRVRAICECAPDELIPIETLDLISVIGRAEGDIEIAESYDDHCTINLKDCRVKRPRFWDWIRYKLKNILSN